MRLSSSVTALRLPSTKDLRAFELAARLGSIKAAADELHVSPSALSRRIQSLENQLGKILFIRDTRGVTLTETGKWYAEELREIFASLENVTRAMQQTECQRLIVAAPSVIVAWLMPRLTEFEQLMPNIDFELHSWAGAIPEHLDIPDADIAFSWGEGNWPDWDSTHITPGCHLTPLCSPQLLKKGRLMTTDELAKHTWIITVPFEDGWKRWFTAMNEPLPRPRRILKVNTGLMAVDAADRGQGILMGHGFFGMPSMAVCLGSLTYAHGFHALTVNYGHHLHARNLQNPAVECFKAWFFETVWNIDRFLAYADEVQKRKRAT